jgi:hypothetical protein
VTQVTVTFLDMERALGGLGITVETTADQPGEARIIAAQHTLQLHPDLTPERRTSYLRAAIRWACSTPREGQPAGHPGGATLQLDRSRRAG